MRRSKRVLSGVGLGALVVLGLASCASGAGRAAVAQPSATKVSSAQCAANKAAGTVTFVSPFGFDASVGILDIFAAQSLGYFADECVTVQIADSGNVNSLVSSGEATITGEGSAADTLLAQAEGSKFTGVLTFGDTSDYAILTRESVPSLKDLEGKTLGYHYVMPVVLTEMLEAAHVDIAKVHEVNDPSYIPQLVITGPYDGLQAYQSNEPITLRAAGDAFHEFLPSTYGVSGTFNVQVVNTKFLTEHPVAISDFFRAELHAYDYCTVHVAQCIAIEAKAAKDAGASYETAHETTEWNFETGLVAHHTLPGKGTGVETVAEWAPERAALVKVGLAKSSAIPPNPEDPAIVAALYHGTKLVWPGP